ncbi:MAG: GIY-YIG nuclease family protein [Ramlibacter sp.]
MTTITAAADRRRLARAARDAFPPMGVYLVRASAGAHLRVGACRDVHARLRRIQFELRLGSHPDKALQAAWRQDPAGFSFEVLALVEERSDPAFDHQAELQTLLELHRAELGLEASP